LGVRGEYEYAQVGAATGRLLERFEMAPTCNVKRRHKVAED
jgi:hypothetical protein